MSRKNKRTLFEKLEVIDAGAKGKSVARTAEGQVVFVNNAVPGDIADVQTFKKRRSYYEGTAVHFHTWSDKRTTPLCEHFGVCGGCKWQHMAYEHQLFYKQKEVENNLKRLGGIELPELHPILRSSEQYHYRNKMEFSFSNNRWITKEELNSENPVEDRNALGFHIPGMWDKILDLNTCYLQAEPSNSIRLAVKEFAVSHNMTFFDVRKQEGLLRTLMIRTSTTGELMVLIQFFEDHKVKREQLLNYLKETFPQITSLQYVINQKANDTLYDQKVICFYGRDHIFEEMEGLKFKINAKSFYQTNSGQAHELYKVTRDFAGLHGEELVYDLYTGTGTIAQFIAREAKKVVGIEAVPEAIEDAKANAQLNAIDNVTFFAGDMKTIFDDTFVDAHGLPDVIITDPPRDGMHKDVVQQILKIAPEKIVYVSCNSATQARDIAMMDAHYRVTRVQPVDMFPQTYHVENVVLLEKRNI
ncbi:23S rRNA (uracil(1939)-C(5))-methyltransferase RlmD [Ascidiimonas aurantiaca]|uniref:23S rRNA (uracil(1939)-C(5))-methyltransferase RlmD n=1 Tax=Ascidiimonas aurantiaca TaxID=1685432 RepID=UPI0030EE18C0